MAFAASIIWLMLAATAVNENATIVNATITSISVKPRFNPFGRGRLDFIVFTETDLTQHVATHNQFPVRLRTMQANFVHARLAACENE